MGRGRGKGKKQTIVPSRDDLGSGEEGPAASKRRGRPNKTLKGEVVEEDEEKDMINENNDDENANKKSSSITGTPNSKDQIALENGTKRRKRSSQMGNNINKEKADVVKEENYGSRPEEHSTEEDCIKSLGFRQNGSRRKSKPRRAAEVGVECK